MSRVSNNGRIVKASVYADAFSSGQTLARSNGTKADYEKDITEVAAVERLIELERQATAIETEANEIKERLKAKAIETMRRIQRDEKRYQPRVQFTSAGASYTHTLDIVQSDQYSKVSLAQRAAILAQVGPEGFDRDFDYAIEFKAKKGMSREDTAKAKLALEGVGLGNEVNTFIRPRLTWTEARLLNYPQAVLDILDGPIIKQYAPTATLREVK